ncbi:MAG: hypothetical protein A2Y95_00515 [Deltaproteobacteria bacterium RBG_13_65_10]|jgi:cytochrome c-type biogenesis protein CcmH|nr:MAG: hypothetical protein A2Y95_00515 [Deltaproteobacteria bacterium RBG_13_65_10]
MTLSIIITLSFILAAAPGCGDRRSEQARAPESGPDVSEFLPGHGSGAPAWPATGHTPGEGLSRPTPAKPTGPAGFIRSRYEISGTVTLAPGAPPPPKEAVLFVTARKPGQGGPPLAVVPIREPRFPQPFRIGAENAMMGGALQGDVEVAARLDLDGNVSTHESGNLAGVFARNPVRVGQTGIVIALSPGGNEGAPPTPAQGSASLSGRPERGASISGTIRLAPGAKAPPSGVLYISARLGTRVNDPPFAVRRIDAPQFPVAYAISNENVMEAGIPFKGEMTVTARLDTDGNASTKDADDLVGSFAGNPALVGQSNVDFELAPAR